MDLRRKVDFQDRGRLVHIGYLGVDGNYNDIFVWNMCMGIAIVVLGY
jgi:hypothetical protein